MHACELDRGHHNGDDGHGEDPAAVDDVMHSVAHGITHLAEADRDEDHPNELDAEEAGEYD